MPDSPAGTNVLSIVVPAFNEAPGIESAVREIRERALQTGLTLQLIAVDDGSTDGTWGALTSLAADMAELQGFACRGISAKKPRLPPASTHQSAMRRSSSTPTCSTPRR